MGGGGAVVFQRWEGLVAQADLFVYKTRHSEATPTALSRADAIKPARGGLLPQNRTSIRTLCRRSSPGFFLFKIVFGIVFTLKTRFLFFLGAGFSSPNSFFIRIHPLKIINHRGSDCFFF